MAYSIDGLEKSRNIGFSHKNILGSVLKEFLYLSHEDKILDLGCGTGFFTRIIAEQVNAEITGMDINETLLDGADKISKAKNLDIKYEKGDITDIKYPDNTFDVVMCDIMLECFKDISIPLKEMKRVCKAGGIVVAIEPFYQSYFEYYPEVDNKTRDLILKFSRAGRAFGVGPMLPNLFNSVGLSDIDLIGWFWGGIEYKTLGYESIDEKIYGMNENLESIRKHIANTKQLNVNEQNSIVEFYEKRLKKYEQSPLDMKQDMGVKGLPVFIVKGTKTEKNVSK